MDQGQSDKGVISMDIDIGMKNLKIKRGSLHAITVLKKIMVKEEINKDEIEEHITKIHTSNIRIQKFLNRKNLIIGVKC